MNNNAARSLFPSFGRMARQIGELLPRAMSRFASWNAIDSLTKGMMGVMPVMIVGSMFLLLADFPVTAVNDWFTSIGVQPIFEQVYTASYSLLGLMIAVTIAYHYATNRGYDGISAAVISLVTFFILLTLSVTDDATGVTISSAVDLTSTGSQGMFGGIVIGELTGVIYCWFLKRNIVIKLPDSVPPAVLNAFVALIPAAAIFTGAGIVFGIFDYYDMSYMEWIYSILQVPLSQVTDSYGGVLIYTFLRSFLWIFGIHPDSATTIVSPILTANSLENQAIIDAGQQLTVANGGHIFTYQFAQIAVWNWGSGCTIGLVLYMLFRARSAHYKALGKLTIAPSLFNINEPVIFGVPLVLNPMLAVPLIMVPLVNATLCYFSMYFGLVPLFDGLILPWTVPPLISGIFWSWQNVVLQAVCLVVSVLIYLPFARAADRRVYSQELEATDADDRTNVETTKDELHVQGQGKDTKNATA